MATYTAYAVIGTINANPPVVQVSATWGLMASDGSTPSPQTGGVGYNVTYGDSSKDVMAALTALIVSRVLSDVGVTIANKDVIFIG